MTDPAALAAGTPEGVPRGAASCSDAQDGLICSGRASLILVVTPWSRAGTRREPMRGRAVIESQRLRHEPPSEGGWPDDDHC